jgi:phospholipid/cholesterol/gamma-HCH transport system substrate-binding protein
LGALADVQQMLPAVQKLLPKLDSILYNLNTLSRDPAIAQSLHNVRDITNDLTYTTKELNTLMGTLNSQVPGMLTKANGVLDNTKTLTSTLNSKVEGLDIEKTMSSVNATLANVQKFTDELNNNQGSLGLLMRDPTLYNNLTSTVSAADSLLVDLKAHPKRYVHFSIFGKKSK